MARRQDRKRRERPLLAKLRRLEREEDARRGLGAPAVDPFGSLDFGTAPEAADAAPFGRPPFGFLAPLPPGRNALRAPDSLGFGDSTFQSARGSDPTEHVEPRQSVCQAISKKIDAERQAIAELTGLLEFGKEQSVGREALAFAETELRKAQNTLHELVLEFRANGCSPSIRR